MGARRNGFFILGISVLSIVVSIAIFAYGSLQIAEIDVEEEAIFTGRNGVVSVEEYGGYSVFVVSDYTCDEVEVSIYDEDDSWVWEYFFKDCDAYLNEDGWIYVGYFTSDFEGSLNVEANRQISIIDDVTYFDGGGGAMFLSLPFCCLGLIGLIIAITVLITSKGQDSGFNSGIIIIQPASDPENPISLNGETVQAGAEGTSEWWDASSKPE